MPGKQKIFVGLSGGVDSSVAALLLRDQGHDVTGVFLRCVNLDGCADQDAEDARRVAAHLGIPFFSWDFEEEYRRAVVGPLVAGYEAGETPNPDAHCNREIKFGAFLDAALRAGADAVATGHYAQVREEGGEKLLVAGVDPEKDQSYFLALLTDEQLARSVFPLGGMLKSEVRRIAAEAGLPTAQKKDSQGICFLGKVSLSAYLREQIGSKPGVVYDVAGNAIGEHDGAMFLTLGQRSGFRITAQGRGGETPAYYVAKRDVEQNAITVAEAGDASLAMSGVVIQGVVARGAARGGGELRVLVRTRYRQELVPATLRGSGATREVQFDAPHPASATGQIAACYDGPGALLAAGTIAETL
jgi:tRNA-uridine 2-sulfurtransferase